VRRELGDADRILVEKMGEVVVEACYERVGDHFEDTGSGGFKRRTQHITDKLKDPRWRTYLALDDLLKLRKGKEGYRWVHRIALIRPDYDRSEPAIHEHMIAWIFVEVPEDVTKLIRSPGGLITADSMTQLGARGEG
jgi:hypothetical protein